MTMLDTSDLFVQFEAAADDEAHTLIQEKPLRSVMTLLHLGNFLLSQNRGYGNEPDESIRGRGVERLGYLLPLVTKGETEFKGASALDAIFGFGDECKQSQALSFLYSYAELCQVAPFVHRGAYRTDGGNTAIKLTFRSEAFASAEVKDILVSALFQPFTLHNPGFAREWFNAQVPALPTVDFAGNYLILQELTTWFTEHAYEISPLSEAAMPLAVGVGLDAFRRFAAACMALGQYHMSMADAIARRAKKNAQYGTSNDALFEQLEWISPCYSVKYVQEIIVWLAKLEHAEVKKLMGVYATIGGNEERRGEGFFPPFFQSGDTYIFSPVTIRHMMSSRNVLYSLAKSVTRKVFDSLISKHLEPQLIAQASIFFNQLQDVEICRNVKWSEGEIDILIYRRSENTVLVVEAKGAIAPEGARMVYHVQSRIIEGIEQLRKFDALAPADRDQILTRALRSEVKDVRCVKAVLGWASFGTEDVWSQFTDIAPLNIALLAELVRRNSNRRIDALVQDTLALIEEIVTAANAYWEPTTKSIGPLTFERPALKFNEDALIKFRTAQHR